MTVYSEKLLDEILSLLSYPMTVYELANKIDLVNKPDVNIATLNSYIKQLRYNKQVVCFGKDNRLNKYISKEVYDKITSCIVIDDEMTIEQYYKKFNDINKKLIENGRIY